MTFCASAHNVNSNPKTIAHIKAQLAKRGAERAEDIRRDVWETDRERIMKRKIKRRAEMAEFNRILARRQIEAQAKYPRHTAKSILLRVCWFYGLKMSELVGPGRSRNLVLARKAAMFWMKQILEQSYPFIGRNTGDRDHTTALHGVLTYKKTKSEMKARRK